MDQTFDKSVRPDPKTGLCPEGTIKCSENTDLEKTVCIDGFPNECPITSLYAWTEEKTPAQSFLAEMVHLGEWKGSELYKT